MSVSIDKKVVEMRFDNSDFERKVTETLQTLKLLQTTLDNTESAKSLRGLSDAVDGINFRGLNGALDMIQHRFSTLGIVGMTVIQNITDSALNAAKNVLSTVKSSIIQGGITRATNIENAKFMLQGLGVAWKDIAEDIDYGVKDTAYSLDAAAKAASSLVASGVKLGNEMKTSLRGISGVAAMTNSDYESISNIFTTVAGQNRLMTMQLRQLEGRGLNAAATLKDYFNRSTESLDKFYTLYNSHKNKKDPAIVKGAQATEEAIRTMVTNGAIDFQLFSDAMDSTFGQHAKDANKTFNGAMSNIKSALARIGAEFVQPLIQNEGPLVGMLNAIRVKINDVKNEIIPFAKESTDALNNLFTNLASKIESADLTNHFTILRNLVDIFKNALSGLGKILKTIGSAFKQVFPESISGQIANLTTRIKDFTDKLTLSDSTLKKLKDTFSGIFSVWKIGRQIVSSLLGPAGSFLKILGSIANWFLDLTASAGRFLTKLAETTDKMNFFKNIFSSFKPDTSGFETFADKVTTKLSPIEIVLTGISKVIQGIATVAKKAAQIIKNAFSFIFDFLSKAFSGLGKSIKEFDGDTISKLFNSGLFLIIAKNLKELIYAFQGFLRTNGTVRNMLNSIGEQIRSIGISLNKTFEQLQRNLKVKNIKTLATAVLELAIACLILSTIDNDKLAASLLTVSTLIGELMLVMKSFDKMSGKGLKDNKTFRALQGIAIAILILAVALKTISSIPFGAMMGGLLAISILLGELVLVALAFSKFESSFRKSASSMILMAIAINLLVKPVIKLAQIPFTSMMKGLLGVSILMAELVAVAFIFSKFQSSFRKAASSMILMSLAINLLSIPVINFSKIPATSLIKGLLGVTIMLGELVAVAIIFSQFQTSFRKAASSMILMAIAINLLAIPVITFSKIKFTSLIKGLLGVSILLAELVTVAIIFSQFQTSFLRASASMILMAIAINLLIIPVIALSKIKASSMIKAILGIAGILLVISTIGIALSAVGPVLLLGAAALVVFSAALLLLVPPLLVLSKMSGGDIAKVILSIGGLLLTLAIGLTAMIIALPGAIALTVAAGALLILTSALFILNAIPFSNLLSNLGKMVVAFLTISIIGGVCGILSPLLLLFGVSLAVVSAAVVVLSTALAALAVSGLAGMQALKTIVTEFILLIPNICLALGEAVVGLCDIILKALPKILEIISKIIVGICDIIIQNAPKIGEALIVLVHTGLKVLRECVPDIIDTGIELLLAFLHGIADNIEEVTETALDIVIGFLNGISSKIQDVIDAGVDLLMNFVEGIVMAIPQIVDRGGEIVVKFLNGFSDSIEKHADDIHKAAKKLIKSLFKAMITVIIGQEGIDNFKKIGTNIIDGIKNGITNSFKKLKDIAKSIGKTLLDGVKSFLGIKSPSKEFEKVGMYSDQGLAGGLKKYSKSVVLAAKNLASDTFDTIDGGLSGLSRIISSELNADPTIRPILDLSSVENGARRINGLLSNQYAMAVAAEGTIGNQNGSGSTIINMTINGAQGQDVNQLADIISKKLNDSIRRRVNVWK